MCIRAATNTNGDASIHSATTMLSQNTLITGNNPDDRTSQPTKDVLNKKQSDCQLRMKYDRRRKRIRVVIHALQMVRTASSLTPAFMIGKRIEESGWR